MSTAKCSRGQQGRKNRCLLAKLVIYRKNRACGGQGGSGGRRDRTTAPKWRPSRHPTGATPRDRRHRWLSWRHPEITGASIPLILPNHLFFSQPLSPVGLKGGVASDDIVATTLLVLKGSISEHVPFDVNCYLSRYLGL